MPTGVHTTSLAFAIDAAMDEARRRTLRALAPLSEDDLKAQPTPILSPLVWDLAHIGHQEELWLLRTLHGEQPTERRFDDIYNACEHERSERAELGLLEPADAYAYVDHVRERVFRRLPDERFPDGEPLRRGGYAYHMVIQHEHQHNETMLQAFQVRDDLVHPFAELWRPARAEGRKTTISLDAGEFTMGTDEVGWAYDNEQRAHVRHVDAYAIDSHPVTNADYVRFVEAGGYADPGLWSDAGRRWLADEGETHPMFWRRSRGEWSRLQIANQVAGAYDITGKAKTLAKVSYGRGVRALGGRAASDRGRVGAGGPAYLVRRAGVGVDVVELRAVPRLQGVPLRGLLGGLLRNGPLPSAPRRLLGDARQGRPAHVPELGFPRAPPDLRGATAGA